MKIAIAAPTYLPARRANTIQVMKMAQAMVELGHEVKIAVPNPQLFTYRWEELAKHYGLIFEFEVTWLSTRNTFRGYDFSWKVIRWLRHWDADLLYTRHPQTAALASWLGIATIFEVHDLPTATWIFSRFLRGKGARRLVIITHALAEDLSQKFTFDGLSPTFVLIVPDGVDLIRYHNLPSSASARSALSSAEQFTVGYTGHLYAGRGTELLLLLAKALPDIQFLLVGGEEASALALQNKMRSEGLQNVIVTGFIANADLALYQAACDVLLMPYQAYVEASSGGDISRYLSPMKAFEYLACGRPIIVSQLPVFREIFNERNAVLVPHDDLSAWIAAIRSLQSDETQRISLGEQARQDAQQYDWLSRAARILNGVKVNVH